MGLQLIQAAAAGMDGRVGFYMGETEWGAPGNWYGQRIGGPDLVDAVSLSMLLQSVEKVDLIDMDVQGAELEVLEAAAREIDRKVKRVHIGTHSTKIDEGLTSLFERLGWKCLRSYPCGATVETEYGAIYFRDGVQTWVNPTFNDRSKGDLAILTDKLEASRREGARLWSALESLRDERSRQRTLSPDSLGWKVLESGARLRDWLAPSGTLRRRIFNVILSRTRQG